jgi:outer membrane biogenesis lipoprotein LolB
MDMRLAMTAALTALLAVALQAGCTGSAAKRADASAANNATIEQQLARIEQEYASRSEAATTDEERRAAFDWYRDSLDAAIRRHREEGSRILREVR